MGELDLEAGFGGSEALPGISTSVIPILIHGHDAFFTQSMFSGSSEKISNDKK